MSAGLLWIILPLIFSIVLLLLQSSPKASMVISAVISTVIMASVLLLKVDHNYFVGTSIFRIDPVFSILGRNILIENADRVIPAILFALSSIYLWLGVFFDAEPSYGSFSIAIAALLTAAIFVETRLFFVLFVELAVLLCLPLLVKKNQRKERGEHFLLIFVSLSIPLLLLSGWSADIVAANPIDTLMMERSAIFAILGFSLLVGVVPFSFWMPQISRETRPVRANFVLSILPFSFLLLLFTLDKAGGWLRLDDTVLHWLRVMGYAMIAVGGIWAAFQEDLERYFAFGLIIDNGFAFLAIESSFRNGSEVFFLLLTIRLILFFLMTVAFLHLNRQEIDLTINGIRGKFIIYPFAFILLFFTVFSFNALPLMANFTIRFGLLQELQSIAPDINTVLWPLIGQVGFFLGALRFLGSAVGTEDHELSEVGTETWPQRIVFMAGMLVLLLLGFLPSQMADLVLRIWSGFGT